MNSKANGAGQRLQWLSAVEKTKVYLGLDFTLIPQNDHTLDIKIMSHD